MTGWRERQLWPDKSGRPGGLGVPVVNMEVVAILATSSVGMRLMKTSDRETTEGSKDD